MSIVLGIVFIVLGLFLITPFGAAIGARTNRKHAGDRHQDGNYKAKSVPGVMLTGVVFVAAGIYVVVRASS